MSAKVKRRTERFVSVIYDWDKGKFCLSVKVGLFDLSRGRLESNELLYQGVAAPIRLTWEITYNCNLHCVHGLSSFGGETANELSLLESKQLTDELAEMQVLYVNIGGGEPLMLRPRNFNDLEKWYERWMMGGFFVRSGKEDREVPELRNGERVK